MIQQVHFETPENIQVSYRPAGLGTRFAAWIIDQILVNLLTIGIIIALFATGIASSKVMEDMVQNASDGEKFDPQRVGLYFIALIYAVLAFGSFLYFSASEFFWNGQTFGKARMKIRVVKSSGFALDSVSILIRNIFRLVDNLAAMWIVPFVNSKSQRLGDLVAGTIVISEQVGNPMGLRQDLAEVSPVEATFRFSASSLKTLNERQFEAAARLLERWGSLNENQRRELGTQVSSAIAKHLKQDPPAPEQQFVFLKDLVAAEYRRQHRELG